MINERNYFEINESNCVVDNNTMTITIPADMQSNIGCELYFNKDFAKQRRKWRMKKVSVSPESIEFYWNWLATSQGSNNYLIELDKPINIGKYTMSGVPGGFGFSGIAEGDITITIELAD